MLTLFSAPKPFTDPHIDLIQRNAIRSWQQLGGEVQILLLGDEPGIASAARELGTEHCAAVARNEHGTPRLDSIFALAHQHARHSLLAYVNTDILLMDDLLQSLESLQRRFTSFLVVGQRWDLAVMEALTFDAGWRAELRSRLQTEGRLHPPAGSDYFAFPRPLFANVPPFALGRAGWDNWMIYAARRGKVPVIDASRAITAIHQDHDYGHLPGGAPHYRLPESYENVRLGGGRETVFRLVDADWTMDGSRLRHHPWGCGTLGRRLESQVYLVLGPGRLVRLASLLMHPIETTRYWIRRLSGSLGTERA